MSKSQRGKGLWRVLKDSRKKKTVIFLSSSRRPMLTRGEGRAEEKETLVRMGHALELSSSTATSGT